VDRLWEAWNTTNEEGVEVEEYIARAADLLDPEIEYVPEAVDPGVRRGIQGSLRRCGTCGRPSALREPRLSARNRIATASLPQSSFTSGPREAASIWRSRRAA